MDQEETAHGIRALHPADLTDSRNKLYWFLVGWMGGPPVYIERFGHPRLRMRHAPFPIGVSERDQWLWCSSKRWKNSCPTRPYANSCSSRL
jgi:hemoglobin